MIRYDLRCACGHAFEAWFRDSVAYEAQRAEGSVACAFCGATEVEKALMAPAVRGAAATAAHGAPAGPTLSAPSEHPATRALAELRAHLEREAEHVGRRFATEARRIHLGEAPDRAIWGEATAEEARALREDGVPVAPLPPLPHRND